MTHVEGENKGCVIAYTLSTCVWCKKTKKLLTELGVEYYYVDVDLLDGDLKQQVKEEVRRWNPRGSYPTIVVDDEKVITGYDAVEIKKRFG
jgi:glutaredoxin